MTGTLTYIEGATLPNAVITPTDDNGTLVDLTDGELVVRVGSLTSPVFEKDTGLTVNPDLTVEIDWDPADLGTVRPGTWRIELVATIDGELRKFAGVLKILAAMPAA